MVSPKESNFIAIFLVCALNVVYCWSLTNNPTLNKSTRQVTFRPSFVEFVNVSKKYPDTWQRRVLSSVPFREFALRNISLFLDSHQLVLIEGPSSSGKSTLLNAILDPSNISSGEIFLKTNKSSYNSSYKMLPVYLDQKPSMTGGSGSILQALENEALTKHKPLLESMASILGFDTETWKRQRVSDLSPSEQYRLDILRACLQSCASEAPTDTEVFPAPLLLIDEWMDTETSTVVQAVQKSLCNLVQETGGLVCAVTHKSERWKSSWVNLTIRLNSGKMVKTP